MYRREVPTWENLFNTVLEKVIEKDIPVPENQYTKSLFFTTWKAFRVNLTFSRKL